MNNTPEINVGLGNWYSGIDFESTKKYTLAYALPAIKSIFANMEGKEILACKCRKLRSAKRRWHKLREKKVTVVYVKTLDPQYGWIWQLYANGEEFKAQFPDEYEAELGAFKELLCQSVKEHAEHQQASVLLDMLFGKGTVDEETYKQMKDQL